MKPLRKAVVAIILNNQNEVLIGSSPRDGGFKLPQGGLILGETPTQGIIREVNEELGVLLNQQDIIASYEETVKYYFPDHITSTRFHRGQEMHVFKVQFNAQMIFNPQDDEFDVLLWKKPSIIASMDISYRKAAYIRAFELCGLTI